MKVRRELVPGERTRMELGEDDRGLSNVSCPVSVTKFLQPI